MANVIKIHNLFPTVASEFKYIADKKLIDAIKNQDLWEGYSLNLSQQSKNNTLHKEKEFESITNKILETTKEICDFYEYSYKSIEITNLWVNFSSKNRFHSPHTHSNNIFSGVWFPFQNTSKTPIIFQDPRAAANVLVPKINNRNKYNSSLIMFQPHENVGYIFPSWLSHYVPPTTTNRISLSWNIILRGEYGEPNTLQNAHI